MARCIGAVLVAALAVALAGPARAGGEQDAKAILDKAIKALGGEEKLSQLKAYTIKGKGIGYMELNQHYCLIERVEGQTVYSIDGNTVGDDTVGGEVNDRSRPRSAFQGFLTVF